ncbi:MAG TPA: D-alanyl-D-alanine carboxypeptidase family protein [Isosphaeraceae bacterium]|nr:D-alanyl-D-alanine carboxypeptidase family protein [Isosphaeraceae bacterium]
MKGKACVVIWPLILAGLCLVGFGPPALAGADDLPATVDAHTLAAARQQPPPIQASAAAVVDGDTGELVWGKNPHQPLPPASMTKMLTALVALERGNPDEPVISSVDGQAMALAGDSVMGLHPGERLSLRDLLFGLLVPSGDDAALAIATAIAGSEPAFVTLMNQTAARLGLTDSHFVNPHGLDAAGHVSSPYDMIVIARAAMRYPLFRQIVATRRVTIRGRWTYDLTNTNYFLGRRPDVIGVKTGTTERALHAITIADRQGDHVLYLTVMHTPDYVPDASALLDYFLTHYTWIELTLPDSPLLMVRDGPTTRRLQVDRPAVVYLPTWQAETLSWTLDLTPDAPLRVTDNPDLPDLNDGAVTFYAGGAPLARLPLVLR